MDARRVNQSAFYQMLNVCQSVNQSVIMRLKKRLIKKWHFI